MKLYKCSCEGINNGSRKYIWVVASDAGVAEKLVETDKDFKKQNLFVRVTELVACSRQRAGHLLMIF